MKKNLSRIASLVAVAFMLVAGLLGCAQTPAATASPTVAPATIAPTASPTEAQTTVPTATTAPTPDNSPYTITQFVNFSWYPDDRMNMDSDSWKELRKITGLDFDIQKASSDDGQQLNIMIASNNLPDLVTMDKADAVVTKLINGQKVFCINDLIEQYAPDIYKNCEPEYFKYTKADDGKNYYFTNFIETPYDLAQPDYNSVDSSLPALYMQQDIYNALGKPDVTDPDALFNVLMQIKQKYPDLIPYHMGPVNTAEDFFVMYQPITYFMGQFGLKKYDLVDGKVQSVVRDQKFVDWLMFMNKLSVNGLLAPESFVDNTDVFVEKLKNAKLATYSWDINSYLDYGSKKVYQLMPYYTQASFTKAGSGWTATMVSKNCKNVKRVMDFLNYITTLDGRYLVYWGVKGDSWELKDGKFVYTQKLADLLNKPTKTDEDNKAIYQYGISCFMWLDDQYILNKLTNSTPEAIAQQQSWQAMYKQYRHTDNLMGMMDPPADAPEGIVLAKLRELAQGYYPKIVMAKDQDTAMAQYNEFMQKVNDAGLAQVEAYWTKKYNLFQ